MTLPPLLLGAALAFWGWRSGNYVTAGVLAVLAEAPRVLPLRFALRPPDLTRIADLCAAFFVGTMIWLLISVEPPRTSRAVLTSLLWLPAILAPILLAQQLTREGRIPLSAIFRYLRKLKARDPTIADPAVDMSGVYFVTCLIAASIPNLRDGVYYIVLVVLVAWSLGAARPAHGSRGIWAAVVLASAVFGYAGQRGLSELQSAVGDWITEWHLRGMAADPYRSTTELGTVGRLKTIEAIVLRVYATAEEASRIKLLHRASFTSLHGRTWVARGAPMHAIEPQEDGSTWMLMPDAPEGRTRIVTRLEGGKALLSMPAGTMRLSSMPATSVKRNSLGATLAELGGDWAAYVVEYGSGEENLAPQRLEDLQLPHAERVEFDRLAEELGLRGLATPQDVLRPVREHFAGFAYALYRESPPPPGSTALGDFLRRSRSGHCEYFAAATTLLLRAGGIPARYATGFAVNEYSPLEGAYIVRARHSHAWTRALVDGRWVDLDTTPPSWFEEEARGAPAWQALADFARWAGFRWSQRGELQGGAGWYLLLAALVAIFAWRMLRGKRIRDGTRLALTAEQRPLKGADSEFYEVERLLSPRLGARSTNETLAAWVTRVTASLDVSLQDPLNRALALHNRHRFDPAGLDESERVSLRTDCRTLDNALD